MKRNFLTISLFFFIFVSATYVYSGSGVPSGWPSKLAGEGEFMIFLRTDLRYDLYKVDVTIKKVEGTTLYTGTTLIYDGVDYSLDYPFSCTDYLTLNTIQYVKDSYFLQSYSQLNRFSSDWIGHVGHSYDSLLAGTSSRAYMLGYGLYEISMKFYYTSTSYSLQRWYVDLKDPNYPYDTHGHPQYYDICFCVNPGNGNDYSASAYLSNSGWESWYLIQPNATGKLSDAFYNLRYHRNVELGLGPSQFQHVPLSVTVSGPSVIYARYRSTVKAHHDNTGLPEKEGLSVAAALSPTATATYTAYPQCGTQQYTYQWHLKKPGWTNWIYQGSGKSVTITQTSDFYIRCTVTSGTETASSTKFVDVVIIDDIEK